MKYHFGWLIGAFIIVMSLLLNVGFYFIFRSPAIDIRPAKDTTLSIRASFNEPTKPYKSHFLDSLTAVQDSMLYLMNKEDDFKCRGQKEEAKYYLSGREKNRIKANRLYDSAIYYSNILADLSKRILNK